MSKRVGSSDPRDDDEARAFEEAMRGAQPIAAGPRRVTGAPVAGPSRPPAAATASAARSPFETEALGEGLSGRARDVSLRVLRALRNGEHRPEARPVEGSETLQVPVVDSSGRVREAKAVAVVGTAGEGNGVVDVLQTASGVHTGHHK